MHLWIQCMLIRELRDQRLFNSYPRLFAVFHARHRLLTPRHPPCALSSLTTNIQSSPPAPGNLAIASNQPQNLNLVKLHRSMAADNMPASHRLHGTKPHTNFDCTFSSSNDCCSHSQIRDRLTTSTNRRYFRDP